MLRDADGQLCGHLFGRRTEDRGRRWWEVVARGGKLNLVGYLWQAARALCVCVCVSVCVYSGFFCPPSTNPLSEAQRLDVTLPPWLWRR